MTPPARVRSRSLAQTLIGRKADALWLTPHICHGGSTAGHENTWLNHLQMPPDLSSQYMSGKTRTRHYKPPSSV